MGYVADDEDLGAGEATLQLYDLRLSLEFLSSHHNAPLQHHCCLHAHCRRGKCGSREVLQMVRGHHGMSRRLFCVSLEASTSVGVWLMLVHGTERPCGELSLRLHLLLLVLHVRSRAWKDVDWDSSQLHGPDMSALQPGMAALERERVTPVQFF